MGIPFFYWLSLANRRLALGCWAVDHGVAGRFFFCLRLSGKSEGRLRVAARMAVGSAPLWLLVLLAVALRESCFGASSHSMKYFSTGISEPSQGLPQFVIVGYVDGQVFVHYDSNNRRMKPRVSWMEKVGKEDPQYWDRNTQISRSIEQVFRDDLETLRNRYNQSEGLHIIQEMYGCELRRDGSKGGFEQHGYEGRTFITFDKETLTWVAPDPQAQITQRKWDAIPGKNERHKSYLEKECIEWLEKHLSYGKEMLLRTGDHLDPGWTFLLYGRISRTHSAPLGPLSGACLPWWESSSSPSSPSCRTWEALFGSHYQAAIQWTRKCSLCLAGKALQGVLFTALNEATICGYSVKPPLAKL